MLLHMALRAHSCLHTSGPCTASPAAAPLAAERMSWAHSLSTPAWESQAPTGTRHRLQEVQQHSGLQPAMQGAVQQHGGLQPAMQGAAPSQQPASHCALSWLHSLLG